MKFTKDILIIMAAALALSLSACSRGGGETNSNVAVANTAQTAPASNNSAQPARTAQVNLATPTETVKAFYAAILARDENALRQTLSRESLKNAEEILALPAIKEEGITSLVDLIGGAAEQSDSDLLEPEVISGSEKIAGNKATLEVRPANTNLNPTKVDFVKEGNEWKLDSSAESKEALAALKEADKKDQGNNTGK